MKKPKKNPAAVALGKLRAAAGDLAEIGRKGGKKGGRARAKSLTPERRREIARKAAAARWGKKLALLIAIAIGLLGSSAGAWREEGQSPKNAATQPDSAKGCEMAKNMRIGGAGSAASGFDGKVALTAAASPAERFRCMQGQRSRIDRFDVLRSRGLYEPRRAVPRTTSPTAWQHLSEDWAAARRSLQTS